MSSSAAPSAEVLKERWSHLRSRLAEKSIDAVVVNSGADLAYLTGHGSRSWERLTALVGCVDSETPTLLVPELERLRVNEVDGAFAVATWSELQNPVDVLLEIAGDVNTIAVSDDLWGLHVLSMVRSLPEALVTSLAETIGGVRTIKTESEMAALLHVGSLADQVMGMIQRREISLVGRTELEIADDIRRNLLSVGHDTVEFIIVASGPNSASPHHHPGDRVVQADEMVLFDFGGSCASYNSDTTRCVFTGAIPSDVQHAYDVLARAQQAAVDAAAVGGRLCDVDEAARSVIRDAGFGDAFIHRVGHGIGVEVHEQPYVTGANQQPIEVGHAFSIEPGIYLDGKWGMRLEDIVVIGKSGAATRCNNADRSLVSVA